MKITNKNGLQPAEVAQTEAIRNLILKAKRLDFINKMYSKNNERLRREGRESILA